MSFTINIIGAGNLGKTIAKLLFQHKVATIQGIVNQSYKSAEDAIIFIGQGTPFANISQLPVADITFITTPDDMIEHVCNELAEISPELTNKMVIHCSGSLSSNVLQAAKDKGAAIASVHPMRSFANPAASVEQYNGTYCAVEGDVDACTVIQDIFQAIGSITYPVNGKKKSLYHASGVFASNYMVALCKESFNCLKEANVPEEIALDIVLNLMTGTLSNLEKTRSPEQALTGPIKRGDINTVKDHLNTLNSDQNTLYRLLGLSTLKIADLSPEKENAMHDVLTE